jgi:hypothetical protein
VDADLQRADHHARRTTSRKVYLHSRQELRDCFKSVGLEDVRLFGDLMGGEFGFHAERLVALAQK